MLSVIILYMNLIPIKHTSQQTKCFLIKISQSFAPFIYNNVTLLIYIPNFSQKSCFYVDERIRIDLESCNH